MAEEKLTKEQIFGAKLLKDIKKFFGGKKEIKYIRVVAGTQKFIVKDKKKIKYYRNLASQQATNALKNSASCSIRITKVVYE